MPGAAKYNLLILFEDEIRAAAKLLAQAHKMYADDPGNEDANNRAMIDAICACAVALQGADDDSASILLTNKPAHKKAMRRDAERYRWLRQDAAASGWKPPRCPNPCPDGIATCTTRHTHEVTGAALDDAIEAAMREQGANAELRGRPLADGPA